MDDTKHLESKDNSLSLKDITF